MELDFKQLNELVNDAQILPGINDLVNVLYTEHLNEYLDKKNETSDDRRVLLMFLIMYFYSYLSVPKEIKSNVDVKQTLKAFLSDLIKDHTKRKICLEMYKSFENTVSMMGFTVKYQENTVKEIKED
jgi:hypothetical protein